MAAIQKKMEKDAKEKEKKQRMLQRENEEAEVCGDLVLIYPLIPYKLEFFIEDNYEATKQKLEEEIKQREKEALDAAGGDKRKVDFEKVKQECFIQNIPKYTFDLDLKQRNAKGEPLEKVSKTPEELSEMELRDQVIERIFQAYLQLKPEEPESSSEVFDIKEDYLLQERYIKYQQTAGFLWDAFTSGNAKDKLNKLKQDAEAEEQEKKKFQHH